MELSDIRLALDALDTELIALFERRMELSLEVAKAKKRDNLPIFQPEREKAVLDSRAAKLKDKSWEPATRELMQKIMDLGKEAQKDYLAQQRALPMVAYQGVPGGYGEQAALEHFKTADWMACATFGDVIRAVQNGDADYGVLPIENSVTGPVVQPLDLVAASGLSIVGERLLPIRHCLMGVEGSHEDNITLVVSHEQGLAQCSRYLEAHPTMEAHARRNTAEAAQYVAGQKNPACAAVASRRAAEIYGLKILKTDIQNDSGNTTRFVMLARKPMTTGSKTSIYFVIRNVSGSLQMALEALARHGINLNALHTRPIPREKWSYGFFADLSGGVDQPHMIEALEDLREQCQQLIVLGSYQPDPVEDGHEG